MIVVRWIFQVKPSRFSEAVDLARDGKKNVWPNRTSRIYFSEIGPLNAIVFENEFENMAEREKLNSEIDEKKWGQWLPKWNDVITTDCKNEVWNVE